MNFIIKFNLKKENMFIRQNHKLSYVLAACIVMSSLWVVTTGWAHGGATGILKERMDSMKSMGKAMKGLAAIVKGKAELTDEAIAKYGNALKMGATHIPEMFPEGTNEAPSEALPKIWTEWKQFNDIATQLQKDADALILISGSDARSVKMGFVKISKSCKSCHSEYRQKKAE